MVFCSLGKNYLLLSYDSLGIDANSILEGVLSTSLGKFHFCNSQRGCFCVLDPRGSPLMILKFTWDLVDDLDSQIIFMVISDPLRDVFYAFNPLGMLLRILVFFTY